MAIKIQVWNSKGGVGKSTTSISISGELSMMHNKRVLLCDFDTLTNSTNGILHSSSPSMYFSDMILEYFDEEITEDIHDAIVQSEFENLDILAAEHNKLKQTEMGLARMTMIDPVGCMHDFFDDIEDEYDYIIFDCSQGENNPFIYFAMAISDYILIPTDGNMDGLNGVASVLPQVQKFQKRNNPNLKCLGMFINNAQARQSLPQMMAEHYKETYPDIFIPIIVRSSQAVVGQSRVKMQPLCYFQNKASVTEDFRDLTNYILERIGE